MVAFPTDSNDGTGSTEEDWMRARKRKSILDNKYQFVTFAVDRMGLSTVHRRKRSKGKGKKV